jgi:hypothetical protein
MIRSFKFNNIQRICLRIEEHWLQQTKEKAGRTTRPTTNRVSNDIPSEKIDTEKDQNETSISSPKQWRCQVFNIMSFGSPPLARGFKRKSLSSSPLRKNAKVKEIKRYPGADRKERASTSIIHHSKRSVAKLSHRKIKRGNLNLSTLFNF